MSEIEWDRHGVPHIFAESATSLFYAFGWAQMRSYGDTILHQYARARGEAAEQWGDEDREADWWTKTLDIPSRARLWWGQQSTEFSACLAAFCRGINAYAEANAESLDVKGIAVLPVHPIDVIAHAHRVLLFAFTVDPMINPKHAARPAGSNAWAIGPVRAKNGAAMLLGSPHLPWSDEFRWFEAHLNLPDFSLYGAALIGFPVPTLGFNTCLGWTHTANAQTGMTVYEVERAGSGYRLDGEILEFDVRQEKLRIRRGETMLTQHWEVRRSRHGIVLDLPGDRSVALRIAGLDRPRALDQWWAMARARNLGEFEQALTAMQIPTFSIIYADRDGHIMHLFNGQIPVRTQGSSEYWASLVPGSDSRALWTATHGYAELPRIVDPTTGWVHNANDPPWTGTIPPMIDPEAYPAYMAPRGPLSLRAQWSLRFLAAAGQLSFEDMVRASFSTRMELADRVLEDLLPAAFHCGDLAARAADVLKQWDRRADAESCGAVLFAAWLDAMPADGLFAVAWSADAPLETPRGLADPVAAVAALERAYRRVEDAHGSAAVAWGEVFRMTPAGKSIPASGADAPFGVFAELWSKPAAVGYEAIGGQGFTFAVEFSQPSRAMALNLRENANRPWWPDAVTSEACLHACQQLRPALLNRNEIRANCVLHEIL